MKNIFLTLILVMGLAGSLGLSGCATLEPSEAEINAEAEKAYAEVKAKSKISRNPEMNAMVQRVAGRIAAASVENFKWETVLIESNEVNAWCMPGGKMAVYTGILPVVKNEAGLAAVMGHEVAHATLRHGKERYARAVKGNIVGAVVGAGAAVVGAAVCESDTCRALSAAGGAAAGFAITFLDRKYSRGDETSADKSGQIYMAKAGYDPAESIQLWKRMSEAHKGSSPPEFLSTHPSDERRRTNLSNWLPEANTYYARASAQYGLGAPVR